MQVRRVIAACVLTSATTFVMLPEEAGAFELSGGVSVGGMVVGSSPRLAVSPHAALGWRTESGLMLAADEVASILPAADPHGVGLYSTTSAHVGYAWDSVNVSLGPSLALYTMPACSPAACTRVVGIGLGGHARVSFYFAGPLGLALWGGVDWIGGSSVILPGGVVATIAAGPLVRWRNP